LIWQFLAVAATSQPAPGTEPLPFWADPGRLLFPLLIVGLFYILFMNNKSKRSQDKQHTEMLKNLKRGDKVQTIGGILGTVVDARDTEVVLKVDEGSNTKVKFSRDAIKHVLGDDDTSATK
jgi:preprotein translocase subunit YajC